MITPYNLKVFLEDFKNQNTAVKRSEVLLDDSKLVDMLNTLKSIENIVVIGVLPEYKMSGEEDRLKWRSMLSFFVVEKFTQSTIKDSEALDIHQRTLLATKDLVYAIIERKSNQNGSLCGIFNDIDESSVRVSPVQNKAQCNGWVLELDLLTNF